MKSAIVISSIALIGISIAAYINVDNYAPKRTLGLTVDLSHQNLRNKNAKDIVIRIKNTNVTSLNLRGNRIGNEGIKAIAAALMDSNLTHLDVSSNVITSSGADYLFNILPRTSIVVLAMGKNLRRFRGSRVLDRTLPDTLITELELDQSRYRTTIIENRKWMERTYEFFKDAVLVGKNRLLKFNWGYKKSDILHFIRDVKGRERGYITHLADRIYTDFQLEEFIWNIERKFVDAYVECGAGDSWNRQMVIEMVKKVGPRGIGELIEKRCLD